MQGIARRFEHFFLHNTLWLFLTLLLLVSYFLLLIGDDDSWQSYGVNFLRLVIWFAPTLIFVATRNWLYRQVPRRIMLLLWIGIFVAYPIFLGLVTSTKAVQFNAFLQFQTPSVSLEEFIIQIALLVTIVELAILANNHLLQRLQSTSWWKQLGLERTLLSVLVLIAVIAGAAASIELMESNTATGLTFWLLQIGRFLSYSLQFLIMGLVYYFFYFVNHYVLIPKLLKQKGILYYGFSVAALILLFYPVFVLLIRALPAVHELQLITFVRKPNIFAEDGGFLPFIVMVLSVPIIISNQWFRQNSAIAELEKQKAATELNLLKQQINPHFFFNTLNNLYALSLIQHKDTPEVVLQLSELMRYVIYKGREETVTLQEEVQYIEDYVRLQQMRLHKKLDYHFEKNITDYSLPIPPLLFIILVENAFKHGIEPAEHACFLHVHLQSDKKGLVFRCKNSVETKPFAEKGIGLENLRRRLELRFPHRHSLQVKEKPGVFTACLKLQL